MVEVDTSSAIGKSSITLPTLLKLITLDSLDASVEITVKEGHSLNLEYRCDCRPPCEEGRFHYTSARATATTAAFGGKVMWEVEPGEACVPGPGGEIYESKGVSAGGSYTQGTGRWFGGVSTSVWGFGMTVEKAEWSVSSNVLCVCRDEPCPESGARYPKAKADPTELHLIQGETAQVTITATDEDEDLQPSSISYYIDEQDGTVSFSVSPTYGGGSGGASAAATFSVTCPETDALSSEIRFGVWDEQGNKTSISVPVVIWRGGPSIEIDESSSVWEGGAYYARFRLDDLDFADCDRGRDETVTWGVRDVRGGSVMHMASLPWIATETCSSREAAGSTSLAGMHAVVFVPSEESGEQQFTIAAEDAVGHRTKVVVTPNRHPVATDDPDKTLKTTAEAASASLAIDGVCFEPEFGYWKEQRRPEDAGSS